MDVELGLIEGFYGKPWSWQARADTIAFLAPHGYRFYLHAPKADPYLRRRWREEHPAGWADELRRLAGRCREAGVRFGVGLSPYEAYLEFDDETRQALGRKLEFLDDVGADDVALLFDDMRGDVPDLADRQLEMVDFVAERTAAQRLLVCPTYYSDDPVLDRAFGARPDGYLDRLGQALDASIEVMWTGEEVVSRELSVGHLRRVAETLRRRPFLWDNYPVNDGQRMSRYLHVRGFTGRSAAIADHVAAHGINAALQPVLTRVPALTLAESYREGDAYQYADAMGRAAVAALGPELGARLREDVLVLQDVGLERIDDEARARLIERYGRSGHPGAREVVGWLAGEFGITDEVVRTQ